MEAGENIDAVASLCEPVFKEVHCGLSATIGIVLCDALLERVKDPFTASSNLQAP